MTRSRYKIYEPTQPHFLTSTVVAWQSVFTRPQTVNVILDSWRFLQNENRLTLFGYVILDNHLHWIASAPDLSKEIKCFKSYTARRILDYLKEANAQTLLNHLAFHRQHHRVDQDFQLWQEGSHPEQIQSPDMMLQKLEYTHNNPVKRGFVDDPTHWRYSSARNYAGMAGLIEVTQDWHRSFSLKGEAEPRDTALPG